MNVAAVKQVMPYVQFLVRASSSNGTGADPRASARSRLESVPAAGRLAGC